MMPSEIKNAIKANIKANISIMLWGPPGIGKSDVTRQVADELNYNIIDVRLSQLDPVDLRGLPFVKEGKAHYAIPAWLPDEERDGERGILFLDEINSSQKAVMAAGYQLILDRRLGDYILPDGWSIVAAGNRTTDRAVANRMPSALNNRFMHYDFDVNFNEWVKWAVSHDISPEIIAFLRFRTGLLHDFDPDQRSFPSPRTWEFVHKMLPHTSTATEMELLTGAVGEGAAGEFIAFRRIWQELPDPDLILADPKNQKVPEDPATLYALAGALSHRATETNFDKVVDYTLRMPPEYQVVLVRDSVHRTPEVAYTAAFNEWAAKNSDVII